MNNIENAIKWLKMNGLVVWRIVDEKGRVCSRQKQEKDNNIDSYEYFSQSIDVLSNGSYTVYGQRANSSGAAEMAFSLKINNGGANTQDVAGIGNIGIGAIEAIGYVNQIHAKDLELQRKNWEIKDLEKENKELLEELKEFEKVPKKDIFENMHQIMGMVEKFGANNTNQSNIAGNVAGNLSAKSTNTPEEARIEKALLDFAGLIGGENLPIALEKLVMFAKENPLQLKMFLGIA